MDGLAQGCVCSWWDGELWEQQPPASSCRPSPQDSAWHTGGTQCVFADCYSMKGLGSSHPFNWEKMETQGSEYGLVPQETSQTLVVVTAEVAASAAAKADLDWESWALGTSRGSSLTNPIYRWGKRGAQRLSDWHKITDSMELGPLMPCEKALFGQPLVNSGPLANMSCYLSISKWEVWFSLWFPSRSSMWTTLTFSSGLSQGKEFFTPWPGSLGGPLGIRHVCEGHHPALVSELVFSFQFFRRKGSLA